MTSVLLWPTYHAQYLTHMSQKRLGDNRLVRHVNLHHGSTLFRPFPIAVAIFMIIMFVYI